MSCDFLFCKQKTAYEMRISDWSSDVCSSDLLKNAERPALLVGETVLGAEGGFAAALKLAADLKLVRDDWNGFNIVHTAASRMGALMLGFTTPGGLPAIAAKAESLKALFVLDRKSTRLNSSH